jgi:hypothetical protein
MGTPVRNPLPGNVPRTEYGDARHTNESSQVHGAGIVADVSCATAERGCGTEHGNASGEIQRARAPDLAQFISQRAILRATEYDKGIIGVFVEYPLANL